MEYVRPMSAFVYQMNDAEWSRLSQGPEGRQLNSRANEFFRHWGERAEVLIAEQHDEGIVTYVSVPPKRTFYVRTHYVFRGKAKPSPFPLEDE